MKPPNNFDQRPQPSTDVEKSAVARDIMGSKGEESGTAHAPRFHRLSIAAAANGATITHEHPPKPEPRHGGGAMPHEHLPTIVPHDHPVMQHINAIHDHIAKDCPDCPK